MGVYLNGCCVDVYLDNLLGSHLDKCLDISDSFLIWIIIEDKSDNYLDVHLDGYLDNYLDVHLDGYLDTLL